MFKKKIFFFVRIYIKFYFFITFSTFLLKKCIFFQISHEVLHYLNNMKKLGILNNLGELHRKIKKFKNYSYKHLRCLHHFRSIFLFWPHKFFCWRKWLLKLPEFLLSVREVQMYESYFLQEKNAFPKEIFTLSIKVYEYILEYNAIFVHIYVCIIFFYILNFFRPRGFPSERFFCPIFAPKIEFSQAKWLTCHIKLTFFQLLVQF